MHVRKDSSTNRRFEHLAFSVDDDDVPRLRYTVRSSSSASASKRIMYPHSHPDSGVTIPRETTGHWDVPKTNGGIPGIAGIWLQAAIDAISLGDDTTGNYVNIDYGADEDARNNTDLGDIFSGTPPAALTWASGQGLVGVAMGLRVNLDQENGNSNTTPVVHSVELDYTKDNRVIDEFEVDVNLDASAALIQGRRTDVVTNLRTSATTTTNLQQFIYEEDSTIHYVKVALDQEDVLRQLNYAAVGDGLHERDGLIRVRLRKMLP